LNKQGKSHEGKEVPHVKRNLELEFTAAFAVCVKISRVNIKKKKKSSKY